MCKKYNCIKGWCPSCGYKCYCNKACFVCSSTHKYSCSSLYPIKLYDDVRNKFVCFPCKRMWKSSVSKYDVNDSYYSCDNQLSHEFTNKIARTLTNEELKHGQEYEQSK